MKKLLFLVGSLVLILLVMNLGENKKDMKFNAESKVEKRENNESTNEITQEEINEKASQIKKIFDNIDEDILRSHYTLKSLETSLAKNATTEEFAHEFVKEHFKIEEGKISYIWKPELFDYKKERTVVKQNEKNTYAVKQNKVVIRFEYDNYIEDWRIVGISYL